MMSEIVQECKRCFERELSPECAAQVGRSLDLYLGEAGFEELVASREIDAFVRGGTVLCCERLESLGRFTLGVRY